MRRDGPPQVRLPKEERNLQLLPQDWALGADVLQQERRQEGDGDPPGGEEAIRPQAPREEVHEA